VKKRARSLFLLLFILPLFGSAQIDFTQGLMVGGDLFYGKFLRHSPKQVFPDPDPITGFSIEVIKQTRGREYWQALHGFPRFGFAFKRKDFGLDSVLGHAYALYPQLDIFIVKTPRFHILTRMGFGLCLIDKSYDRENNTLNTSIGSRLNNFTTFGLSAEYVLSPKLLFRLGGNLTHTSNGHVREPNLGLNTAALRFGFDYTIKPVEETFEFDYSPFQVYKKPVVGVRLGLGLKETKVPDGPIYSVYIISAFVSHNISGRSKVIGGFEASFDQSVRDFGLNQDIPAGNENFRPWRYSAFGAHEFVFGRVGFLTQLFFYIDPPFEGKNFLGVKLGPNIYLLKPHKTDRFNVYFGTYLKAHYTVAEYIEATLGVTF
jgi:hypothetical protein